MSTNGVIHASDELTKSTANKREEYDRFIVIYIQSMKEGYGVSFTVDTFIRVRIIYMESASVDDKLPKEAL